MVHLLNGMNKLLLFIIFFSLFFNSVHAQVNIAKFFEVEKGKQTVETKSTGNWYFLGYRVHRNGSFRNTIYNHGVIGNVYSVKDDELDYMKAPDYYFPRNGRFRHGFFTSLWVGGIVNGDTLVSTSIDTDFGEYYRFYRFEFLPLSYPWGIEGILPSRGGSIHAMF